MARAVERVGNYYPTASEDLRLRTEIREKIRESKVKSEDVLPHLETRGFSRTDY